MGKKLVIAIDGPSGAGKSTLSKLLAGRLGYLNIDTGAMYRTVALAASQNGIAADDDPALTELCSSIRIEFERGEGGDRVLLNGDDVTGRIRTPENSLLTARIASRQSVREQMVSLQREMGRDGGVVLEGRDIGSVVFPDADIKFFLVASAAERGRRRYEELRAEGINVDLDKTIAEVEARDRADREREHSPLVMADDAVQIDTTGLGIDEVLERMLQEAGTVSG